VAAMVRGDVAAAAVVLGLLVALVVEAVRALL
jgi:hypothetical protein